MTDTWRPTSQVSAPAPRYQHTAVWTGSEMIVWGGWDAAHANFDSGGRYDPLTDQWTATSSVLAPSARHEHTVVWTGTEMIVWGGTNASQGPNLDTGGRYDPATDTWHATSTVLAPAARVLHSAVWSGSRMIIWGGGDSSGTPLASGGLYDPVADRWSNTSTTAAPTRRYEHSAVWTGSSMIVWGGWGVVGTTSTFLSTGGRYSPATDSWTPISSASAPSARAEAPAVWTGNEMIVWGGRWGWGGYDLLDTGGRYDPVTDSWLATSTTAAPLHRSNHTAVWTGSEMLVWGGSCEHGVPSCNNGGRYNPATDVWRPLSNLAAPVGHVTHAAVWTGTEMIVWGGNDNASLPVNMGGRYNPSTDLWTPTSTLSAPAARSGPTAVWTGTEMIVWGGYDDNTKLGTGGRYFPSTDAWTPTSMVSAPSPRAGHIAVWTGTEMVIWGGVDIPDYFATGGRYDPSSDQWRDTSTVSAPSPRWGHTAVWSGDEILIWGGRDRAGYLSAGGRYRPASDTWTPMSTDSQPRPRYGYSVVWTGSEMIVWGGLDNNQYFGDGGRYSPLADRWTLVAGSGAPALRAGHSAVWTGSEMLVWGGIYGQEPFRDGARYCAAMISPEPQPTLFAIRPDPIPDQQVNVPFAITVEALDSAGQLVRVDATVSLRALVPGVSASPTQISLHGGTGSADVTIDRAAEGVKLQVDWHGAQGTSSPFKVGAPGSCRFRGAVWTSDPPLTRIPGAVVRLVPLFGDPIEIVATDGSFDTNVPCKPYSAIASFGSDYSGVTPVFPLGLSVANFQLSIGCDPTAVNPVLLVPGYLGSTTGFSSSTTPTLGGSGSPATYNDSAWPAWNPSLSFGGLHQFSLAALGLVNTPDWNGLAATLRRINPNYRVGCAIVSVPWDWRREIGDAARTFLAPAIADAVSRSGGRRVWVVTHSTGALLVRSYLRQQGSSSTGAQTPIEKLAMIAPANQGSPKAYYGAEGGSPEAIDDVSGGSVLENLVQLYQSSAEGILNSEGDARGERICYPQVEAEFQALFLVRNDCQGSGAPFTNEDLESERAIYHQRLFNFFSERVRSAAELVPATPFLLDGAASAPRAPQCPANSFLELLNQFDANPASSWLVPENQTGYSQKVKTALFAGCGEPTAAMIRVVSGASNCRSGLFADGEPLLHPTFNCPSGFQGNDAKHGECKAAGNCGGDESMTGDGTLVLSSTAIPNRGDLVRHITSEPTSHADTVAAFKEDVARFLCGGCTLAPPSISQRPATAPAPGPTSLVVALNGRAQPYVSDPLGRASGINPTTANLEDAIPGASLKLDESASVLGIDNPADGSYVLTLSGPFSEEIQLHLTETAPSGQTAEAQRIPVQRGRTGDRQVYRERGLSHPFLAEPGRRSDVRPRQRDRCESRNDPAAMVGPQRALRDRISDLSTPCRRASLLAGRNDERDDLRHGGSLGRRGR